MSQPASVNPKTYAPAAAQAALTQAIANGLTVQEISNLQLAYNAAAAKAAASRVISETAIARVASDRLTLQTDVSGWMAIAQPSVIGISAYKLDLVGSFPFSYYKLIPGREYSTTQHSCRYLWCNQVSCWSNTDF
jgi:hypothetical protein